MAEHILVKHETVGEAMVPAAALSHYEQRGWSKVEGAEAEARSAAASEETPGQGVVNEDSDQDLGNLTREALLEVARERGVEVPSSITKAELLRRLESA